MKLIETYLYPITGLYDECHNISYDRLWNAKPLQNTGEYALSNLNNLWWKTATSLGILRKVVARLQRRYIYTIPKIDAHRLVLANPELFVKNVQEAIRTISNLGCGPKALFSALETLHIFCDLYSDFICYPFTLSLQEGLLLNELSTEVMFKEALDAELNPYLGFIEQDASEIIAERAANLIWIVGPIKTTTVAMAMMAKKANPNAHVSVIGHSTEYYSLNKIDYLLKKNTTLFSLIDSIVLDDFEHTIPELRDALRHGHDLASVPNLIYKETTDSKSIIQTHYVKNNTKSVEFNTSRHDLSVKISDQSNRWIDFGSVTTAKLWPNAKCFWSSCTFCAINKKYNTLPVNDFTAISPAGQVFVNASELGKKFVWSIDEAIPPENLAELADELIATNSDILWETRSKVHDGFTPEVCVKLYSAGLREIRLGLESASSRVLDVMGKHPDGWSLDLVEKVASNFHDAGISVHFPVIVGFPTETADERNETYDFLEYITEKYPSVTFNINILGLDIASRLFTHFQEFGITEIRFPTDPKDFLGNLLDWNSTVEPFRYSSLDASRNEVMRKLLYPWMPTSCRMPVYIFYRLAETSRATLVWKSEREKRKDWRLSDFEDYEKASEPNASFVISDQLAIFSLPKKSRFTEEDHYWIYDWNTHHSLEVDENGLLLLKNLATPKMVNEFANPGDLKSVQELCKLGIVTEIAPAI